MTRFVDLFAGGLTVGLWVLERYPDAELAINDSNEELIDLYRGLASNPEPILKHWRDCVNIWMPLTPEARKAQYYRWREEYTLNFENVPVERLHGLLLFMLQTNFNGMWKAYAKCNRRYSTPPGTCQQSASFFDVKKVRAVIQVLQRPSTHISCGDFADVPLRDTDFVYADPPYRDSIVDYQGSFGDDDQTRLATFLTNHKGTYAYSNKDTGDGFITKNFPSAVILPIQARYTAGRGTSVVQAKEVLVKNF